MLRLGRAVRSEGDIAAVRTLDAQRRSDVGFVQHLDEKQARAPFDELRFRRPLLDADPALGVDAHHRQHMPVERRLKLLDRRFFIGRRDGVVDRLAIGRRERLAQVSEGGFEPPRLLRERLERDAQLRETLNRLRLETY